MFKFAWEIQEGMIIERICDKSFGKVLGWRKVVATPAPWEGRTDYFYLKIDWYFNASYTLLQMCPQEYYSVRPGDFTSKYDDS